MALCKLKYMINKNRPMLSAKKKNQQTNDVFVRRFLVCTHIQNRYLKAILYMRTHQKSSNKNIVCLLIFFFG